MRWAHQLARRAGCRRSLRGWFTPCDRKRSSPRPRESQRA